MIRNLTRMESFSGRLIVACLIPLLASPLPLAAAQEPQQAPSGTPQPASAPQLPDAPAAQPASAPQSPAAQQNLPRASSTTPGPQLASVAQPPAPQSQSLPPSSGESSSQTTAFAQQQDPDQGNQTQKPVGTAAAPLPRTSGVAGSRPAGAAIAPAKQRRVRAFFIRFGIIAAAAGATGAVIGLSHASPSRPQ
jgi:hypothetical protein